MAEDDHSAESDDDSRFADPTLIGDSQGIVDVNSLAAAIGLLAAGIALVVVFVPESGNDATISGFPAATAVRAAAVIATIAFVTDRQDILPSTLVGGISAAASLVVAVGDLLTFQGALSVWVQPFGVPLAGLAAVAAFCMGVAEYRELTNEELIAAASGIAFAAGIGVIGFLFANFVAAILFSVVAALLGVSSFGSRYVLLTIGLGASFVVYTTAILKLLDLDWSFLDLEMPSLRDFGVLVLGLLALLTLNVAFSVLVSQFGIPFAESQIERQAVDTGNTTFLLYLIPLSFLVIAPGEELVYRNLVQKYLYGQLTRWGAVFATSAIFAGMHLSQYGDASPGATLVSLAVVFALSLVLGGIYERTENLVVPILVHGAFNAVSFAGIYVRVTNELAGTMA